MFEMTIVLLFGLLFIYLGFKKIGTNRKLAKEGIITEGFVAGFNEKEREDQEGNISYLYTPVINFNCENNQTHAFESANSYSHPPMKVNDPMSVIYLLSAPGDAKINTMGNKWGPVIFLLVLGAILTLVGVESFLPPIS